MAALKSSAKLMPLKNVRPFLAALDARFPNAETELVYKTHFELLVAVVLSAQATDKSVNLVTPALFAAAPDAFAMSKLDADEIGEYIRRIGLWRSKAQNLSLLSKKLVADHQGIVPDNREDLESLAGVGRKTANVVLNVLFNQPTMAVDTHIFRVSNRTGLAPGKNVRQVEDALVKRIPADLLPPSHHWLILLGRYICKARKPECASCPVTQYCLFPDKT